MPKTKEKITCPLCGGDHGEEECSQRYHFDSGKLEWIGTTTVMLGETEKNVEIYDMKANCPACGLDWDHSFPIYGKANRVKVRCRHCKRNVFITIVD